MRERPSARVTATSFCRYCGSGDLRPVLTLGEQPLSNAFLRESDIPREQRYPLDLVRCGACTLAQLAHTVDPRVVFGDYMYLSSSSQALRRHFAALARQLASRFGLRAGDLVVDIGCNDGVLLREFDAGLVRVGVEPSRVAEIALGQGLEVIQAFYGGAAVAEIVARHGRARLIAAMNVFAHVAAIGEFTAALPQLLAEDGVFVAEASYLPQMIDGVLFDTIYHEHLLYLALTPMIPFLEGHGLRVFDFELVPFGASGPAFRVYACRDDASHATRPSVDEALERERTWGIRDDGPFVAFGRAVHARRDAILERIGDLRRVARIGAYGAPAKGNTLLNYLALDRSAIEMVAEVNPLKQGLVTPGTHIPVVSEEQFLRSMPEYALLLAWNYVDHFLEHSEYIRRGGRFLVPLPEPRVLPI